MSDSKLFKETLSDENLSEELLGEDVMVSNVKRTSRLEINMSKIPFKSAKRVPCLIPKPSKLHPQSCEDNKVVTYKRISGQKFYSEDPLCKSEVQKDIRSLLQKAIKIRSLCLDDLNNPPSKPLHFDAKLDLTFVKTRVCKGPKIFPHKEPES
ncbi:unnamed protein product [Moneuplotes crassus]|uniref:Uncharacterized protein n=1 Tax=Euplotes crassus TaxID=5936 RepID=A0AAD1XDX2_EUPCR|nr:unnamed protein product [Moneuplotes crassus]